MENKVLKFIEQYHMMDNASRVILGVSGGADSVALAHFMVNRFPDIDYVIAHVNHGLRFEADEEESFVRDFAKRLNVSFRSCQLDMALLSKERKRGIEETGREERYRFFRSLGGDLILTAHHKDDQAETMLMHLLRGCGIKGLGGIAPFRGDLARPFLCVDKDEILRYCEKYELEYKTDLSNEDTVYTRNRIRKEWIPLLKEINPNVSESLWRLSQSAAEDDRYLDDIARECYSKARYEKNGRVCLATKKIFVENSSVARRVVRMVAEEYGVSVDFDHTERILSLVNGKCMPLSKDLWVCRYADHYSFGTFPEKNIAVDDVILSFSGTALVGDRFFESRVSEEFVRGNISSCGVFDMALFESGVPVIRTRRNGDYVVLADGKRKKLSDFFIDEKIPSSDRDTILLLAVENRILWVIGYRFFAVKGQENLIVSIFSK